MSLKTRLTARTVLTAALVLALMSTLATQASLYRALNAARAHAAERLQDVMLGLEGVCAAQAIEGKRLSEEELYAVARQYGALLRPASGAGEAKVRREGRRLTASAPLKVGQELVLESDLSEVFAQNRRLVWRCMLISGAGLMAFFLCMRRVGSALLRPLHALTAASADWTAGDLSARAAVETDDELGRLTEQLNAMAAALEEAIARRDQLIGDLTHEMKTPVAAVMGHADLIRRSAAEAETQLHAHQIYQEAARLEALSRRMMQWILLGRDEIERADLSVRLLFERTRIRFAPASIAWEAEDIFIRADRVLMETMLNNLAENALHAGASQVRLAARAENGRVEISVADDGCGMDETARRRAEEPFYRADRARSRAHGGAGLGLSLCRRIVRAHGADMRLDSAPGRGTTVTIALEEAKHEEEI